MKNETLENYLPIDEETGEIAYDKIDEQNDIDDQDDEFDYFIPTYSFNILDTREKLLLFTIAFGVIIPLICFGIYEFYRLIAFAVLAVF